MKSTAKFELTSNNDGTLNPVLSLTIEQSPDVRDGIANSFIGSLGLRHGLCHWRRESFSAEGEKNFLISAYRPNQSLAILDVSALYTTATPYNGKRIEFRDKLVELCQQYGVTIDTLISDGLDLQTTVNN